MKMNAKQCICICSMLTCCLLWSQENTEKQDSTIINEWKPSLVRISYNLESTARTIINNNHIVQEVSCSFDTRQLFGILEIGYQSHSLKTPGYKYYGPYSRIGIDVNLIPYNKNRNAILFGLRYGFSRYNHRLDGSISDGFSNSSIKLNESNIKAHWFESGIGLQVKLGEHIYMGYSFKLRFGNNVKYSGNLLPAYIPGFGQAFNEGRNNKSVSLGFQYFISWDFKLWDKPVPIKIIKKPKVMLPKPDEESGQ